MRAHEPHHAFYVGFNSGLHIHACRPMTVHVGEAAFNLLADVDYEYLTLGEEVRLRDLPDIFDDIETFIAGGARQIELDVGRTNAMTRGAYVVLDDSFRRFAERGVLVQFAGGVFEVR